MRLIDADALIKEWYRINNIDEDDRGARFIGYTEIPRFIANAPTVAVDGDLISRADAIEAICMNDCGGCRPNDCGAYLDKSCDVVKALSALPSAEAVSREVYEKHTQADERIIDSYRREFSEVASAEAVQGWIPFTRRPMTEEEQKDYPNCTFMFDCVLHDDGEEILVSNRRFVWMDTFCSDIDGCYLDSGDDIDEDMAWMPLPEPYKGGEK